MNDPLSKIDTEEELRYFGFFNGHDSEYTRSFELKLNLNLNENEENRVVIDSMKDFYKELKYSHLVTVNMWIKVEFN